MNNVTMPAGYTMVSGIAAHVAEVRKYTSDIRRFREYLPLAEQVVESCAGSPEWLEAVGKAPDPDALAQTVRELGAFLTACADQLERRTVDD